MTENLGFELEGLRSSYSCVLYDPDVCGPGWKIHFIHVGRTLNFEYLLSPVNGGSRPIIGFYFLAVLFKQPGRPVKPVTR